MQRRSRANIYNLAHVAVSLMWQEFGAKKPKVKILSNHNANSIKNQSGNSVLLQKPRYLDVQILDIYSRCTVQKSIQGDAKVRCKDDLRANIYNLAHVAVSLMWQNFGAKKPKRIGEMNARDIAVVLALKLKTSLVSKMQKSMIPRIENAVSSQQRTLS